MTHTDLLSFFYCMCSFVSAGLFVCTKRRGVCPWTRFWEDLALRRAKTHTNTLPRIKWMPWILAGLGYLSFSLLSTSVNAHDISLTLRSLLEHWILIKSCLSVLTVCVCACVCVRERIRGVELNFAKVLGKWINLWKYRSTLYCVVWCYRRW